MVEPQFKNIHMTYRTASLHIFLIGIKVFAIKKGDPVSKRKDSSELLWGFKLSSDREISMGLP